MRQVRTTKITIKEDTHQLVDTLLKALQMVNQGKPYFTVLVEGSERTELHIVPVEPADGMEQPLSIKVEVES